MRTKALVLIGVVVAGAAMASAQAQRQPASLDDIVNELRALRADLRQTTRATTQAQLLTVRLQLQEQRIAVLSTQHNDVATRLALESQMRAGSEENMQRFEEMRTRNEDVGVPRAEIEGSAKAFKQQYELHRGAEQQLRAQEAQLSSEIANEQNRWQDFNNRLDELERSLK